MTEHSMTLTTCPECGHAISDLTTRCVGCGLPRSEALARSKSSEITTLAEFPLFPVSMFKFALMSLVTFGFYELFWSYNQWRRIRDATREDISPFWRTFFAPLWGFDLFGRVKRRAIAEGLRIGWSAGLLGTVFLVLETVWRLPDPWWLISLVSFVPVLPVVRAVERINCAYQAQESPNHSYSALNVIWILIGGLLLLLVVLGTMMPGTA